MLLWSFRWLRSTFFFFFQAEDGIRDWSVTGVQTCALPICDGLVELALQGLQPVVELIDLLDGPGEPAFQAGFGDAAGVFAESGDDRHFGLADLESEDRKSVVEGESVEVGGSGRIKKKANGW